jgi:excisionase family DNA binding protein
MKYLGVRQAADALGVHENTIRRWVDQGILSAARLPGSNYRRFDPAEIDKVRRGMVGRLERDHATDTVAHDAPVVAGTVDDALWDS